MDRATPEKPKGYEKKMKESSLKIHELEAANHSLTKEIESLKKKCQDDMFLVKERDNLKNRVGQLEVLVKSLDGQVRTAKNEKGIVNQDLTEAEGKLKHYREEYQRFLKAKGKVSRELHRLADELDGLKI